MLHHICILYSMYLEEAVRNQLMTNSARNPGNNVSEDNESSDHLPCNQIAQNPGCKSSTET